MPTRAEIIKQTAAEIIVLFEQEQLDENILEDRKSTRLNSSH